MRNDANYNLYNYFGGNMSAIVDIYSKENTEIKKFLDAFYNENTNTNDDLKWEIVFDNPVECADIISSYIDNKDKFNINMWLSLDKDFFINITKFNANKIIKYLFERYPY